MKRDYPSNLEIDYSPESDRLTTFFRLFTVIPILIILATLSGDNYHMDGSQGWRYSIAGPGIVFVPTVLMLLFRKKYPRWWYDWNLELTKFATRVTTYFLLLRDEYPSTDEEQAVHIEIPYPDAEKELHRALPLVKWLLSIPHLIVLYFLYFAVFLCTIFCWFYILATASYPKGVFRFVVGVMRWSLRVYAYCFMLTTDRYPPFRLYD